MTPSARPRFRMNQLVMVVEETTPLNAACATPRAMT